MDIPLLYWSNLDITPKLMLNYVFFENGREFKNPWWIYSITECEYINDRRRLSVDDNLTALYYDNNWMKHPEEIYLNPGHLTLTINPRKITILNYELNVRIEFNTRVYCWDSPEQNGSEVCDIPGPTWIMQAGTTSNVSLFNNLTGLGVTGPSNTSGTFEDIDVSNLHVHGIHVAPSIDDVTTKWVNPECPNGFNSTTGYECDLNRSLLYAYEIYNIHYPGSHWYHAHWPGSVAVQVGGGLYGNIKMLPRRRLVDKEPTFTGDYSISSAFAWFDAGECTSGGSVDRNRGKYPLNFPVMSFCSLWSSTTNHNSSLKYNVTFSQIVNDPLNDNYLKNNSKMFIVNGKVNPYLTIQSHHWYRLRITGITMNYLLFDISHILPTDCEFYLISNDGVYFNDNSRNLYDPPYNGSTVIVPGSRGDVTVRCNTTGNYTIYATNNTRGNSGINFGPVPTFKSKLFTLIVEPKTRNYNGTYHPNFQFLEKTFDISDYLVDTLDSSNTLLELTAQCDTRNYTKAIPISGLENQEPLTQCNLVLSRQCLPAGFHVPNDKKGRGKCHMSVDQINFISTNFLMRIQSYRTHEWLVTSNYHPFHHHIWPFQLQREVTNGWIAQKGDWRDTVGASQSFLARVNYVNYYEGTLIVHCHFVPHEDKGMMAKIQLIPQNKPLDTKNIIPKNRLYTTYKNESDTAGEKLKKKECNEYSGRHFVACINIDDIHSKLLLVIWVEWDSDKGRCVLHLDSGVQLRTGAQLSQDGSQTRQGDIQNVWYGFGFGGTYSDILDPLHNGFNESKTIMDGTGLIFEYNLYDLDNINVSTYEINLSSRNYTKNPYIINFTDTTYLNCYYTQQIIINDTVHVGSSCTRTLHLFDVALLKLANKSALFDNQAFLWAYGEGAFSYYSMHSARNPCVALWNEGTDTTKFNSTNATRCIQKEGTIGATNIITVSDDSECSTILDRFTAIFTRPSGNNNNNEIGGVEIAFIVVTTILVLIIVVMLIWYFCIHKRKAFANKSRSNVNENISNNNRNSGGTTELVPNESNLN